MKGIMEQVTNISWLEHDDKDYENAKDVLTELVGRYNISSRHSVKEPELLKKIAEEIKTRCKISYRQIADLLELRREKVRRSVSTPPSDCAKTP